MYKASEVITTAYPMDGNRVQYNWKGKWDIFKIGDISPVTINYNVDATIPVNQESLLTVYLPLWFQVVDGIPVCTLDNFKEPEEEIDCEALITQDSTQITLYFTEEFGLVNGAN